jgi:hypothetical protein
VGVLDGDGADAEAELRAADHQDPELVAGQVYADPSIVDWVSDGSEGSFCYLKCFCWDSIVFSNERKKRIYLTLCIVAKQTL